MALAAVTHDKDLLALDQVHIGVAIIVDTHFRPFLLAMGYSRQSRGLTRQPGSQKPVSIPMSAIRSLLVLSLALLGACQPPDPTAPTTPAVPMPQVDAAMANSTPEAASRGMSNKTWLWTRGQGPAEIHYSAADGRAHARLARRTP